MLFQYLICASYYHKRIPKQEDGDGGEEEPGFVAETLQSGVPQVLGILTEAFTGINQVVNQSSAGQSQSLPNWILSGVTNLFGQVGQVVGIKPQAPTPPPYFNLPPARPVAGSVNYPANSLSQGQRHQRPTLIPRSTTLKPTRRSALPAVPIEVGYNPFTVQFVGPPAAASNSGENGQFFPAPPPRRTKPKTTTTTTTTTVAPTAPRETYAPFVPVPEPPPPPPKVEPPFNNNILNSGFHSELLSSFSSTLNKLKSPSSSTFAPIPAFASTVEEDEDSYSESPISADIQPHRPTFNIPSKPVEQEAPIFPPPPSAPHRHQISSYPGLHNQHISPVSASLWQAIAHIKSKTSTPATLELQPESELQYGGRPSYTYPSTPRSSYVIHHKITPIYDKEFQSPHEITTTFRHVPPPRPTTSYFVPPKETRPPYTRPTTTSTKQPSLPSSSHLVTETSPVVPSSNYLVGGGGTGSIASVSAGNKRPVIVNNMYYPDLQSALSANQASSDSTTEKPRKRRRRTTTPSASPDPDY